MICFFFFPVWRLNYFEIPSPLPQKTPFDAAKQQIELFEAFFPLSFPGNADIWAVPGCSAGFSPEFFPLNLLPAALPPPRGARSGIAAISTPENFGKRRRKVCGL